MIGMFGLWAREHVLGVEELGRCGQKKGSNQPNN